jgi:hypothetical protein
MAGATVVATGATSRVTEGGADRHRERQTGKHACDHLAPGDLHAPPLSPALSARHPRGQDTPTQRTRLERPQRMKSSGRASPRLTLTQGISSHAKSPGIGQQTMWRSGGGARPLAEAREDLTAPEECEDEERRQGDHDVDKATRDAAAEFSEQCRFMRRDSGRLREPHGSTPPSPIPLKEKLRVRRAAFTQVREYEFAGDPAVPDEPESRVSRRGTAEIAGHMKRHLEGKCATAANRGSM